MRQCGVKLECDVCGKVLSGKYNLKSHKMIHTGDRKSFDCKTCGKVLSCKQTLRNHKQLHTDKSHKCEKCGKYYTKYILTMHVRRCGAKFECNVCGKVVKSEHSLKFHERIHTGHKPFQCEDMGCDKKFIQKQLLQVHMKVHHSNEPRQRF